MLTDQEIERLIRSSKEIKEKIPAEGYKEENNYKRCNLKLESTSEDGEIFSVFIRQNSTYSENYSIGLRYKLKDRATSSVTLIRYNGPHGETSQSEDGHYDQPHIHRITAKEIASDSIHPQEKHREITSKYRTFDEALRVFFDDVGITNYLQYFSDFNQRNLFNGHQQDN